MILLIVVVFYRLSLGTQVVIEVYVHAEWVKILFLSALRLICIAVALDGVFAVLRTAFSG